MKEQAGSEQGRLPHEEGKEENVFPWYPDREENEAGWREDKGGSSGWMLLASEGRLPKVGIRAGRDSE